MLALGGAGARASEVKLASWWICPSCTCVVTRKTVAVPPTSVVGRRGTDLYPALPLFLASSALHPPPAAQSYHPEPLHTPPSPSSSSSRPTPSNYQSCRVMGVVSPLNYWGS
ncbi:hypothetical protein ARMSODRAFT_1018828 [Armillaria solidipes]|uniref:Uncharacterized protein n=1 Tax=Armillaria solidipes TaxID=1076256 RepID=A0A2H3BR18_9AGAR|nr:hypothetical protein ARMSODRAFT_1018828 [Armillaria solidipes]